MNTAGGSDERPEPQLLRPDLAPEYLRNLQESIDAARVERGRLRVRVEKLERDRAVLRERLEAARASHPRARLQALFDRKAETDEQTEHATVQTDPELADGDTVELPGIGRLGPVTWPAPAPSRDLRIGLVADAFTTTALRYEADCLELRSDDATDVLRRERPDLLLVESAYRGAGGSWGERIARFGLPHPDLVCTVEAARELGIPTAFWNKEDPVNGDWFLASLPLFDHVFTVDSGRVPTYRAMLGHDSVHALPFAAQPAIHQPPESPADRTGAVLFAGTWFARKHPERREQMAALLDPARPHGLHILDRHAGDPRFQWPERFQQHVVGSVPYPLAVEATRRYRVVVNVNTVTDSATMCARRVFELAACATPMVSGPSLAVEQLLPAEAVRIVHDEPEAAAAYDELLGNPAEAARMGAAAREWVLDGHTWADRLATITTAVGLS